MEEVTEKKGLRDNLFVLFFGIMFLFSLVMIFNQGFKTTGYATEATTTSNVTISTYFAVEMSANLTNGIQFGSISTLPAADQNATHNYDGVNTTPNGTGTSMWMNVSSDSNTNVSFCIKADALNTSGGDVIGLANETYHNATSTNSTLPMNGSQLGLTTSYVSAGPNIAVNSRNFYRFWLDVPAATASGTYDNIVSLKGVAVGGAC
ncbi:MAG: hypothetical protein AABW50_01570 [Nanoarchaeota archaeon]